MVKGHYAQEAKKRILDAIVLAVNGVGEAKIKAINIEVYDNFGVSPSTTERYLKELAELGKIYFDKGFGFVRSNAYVKDLDKAAKEIRKQAKGVKPQ